jgi:HlyD family secretion protein
MTSKRKRILGAVGALVVLGAIVGFSVARDSRSKIVVQTGKAARRDLISIVSASGEVKPKRYVNIGSNPSGRIVSLLVKEGDAVKRGQVLAKIESERYVAGKRQSEAGVQASMADLDRAIADVDVARLNFERTKKMYADKLISSQAYDQAEAEVKMKQAAVESAKKRIAQLQAQLDSTLDDLAKTTVVSPMDGIVTSLPKEEGEVVIGAQSFSPTVIMTVADLSVMECEIMVDETDIRSVKLGQSAEVRVDALEGIKIKGEVTEIGASAVVRGSTAAATQQSSSAGNTGNQAKDFRVTITLKDPPPTLRPGVNATADITTARRENVLAIPIQAVVVREVDKDGKVVDPDAAPAPEQPSDTEVKAGKAKAKEADGVFLVQKEKAVFKAVKTGVMGDTDIEVLEGVTEGEEIVTGSFKTLRTLRDQAKVKLEDKGKKKERS